MTTRRRKFEKDFRAQSEALRSAWNKKDVTPFTHLRERPEEAQEKRDPLPEQKRVA